MEEEIKQFLEKSSSLFDDRKYSEILALLSDEMLKKYNNAILYSWKARAHIGLKEYEIAKKYANTAILINPNSAVCNRIIGYLFFKLKNFDKALVYLNRSIELDKDDKIAYLHRGLLRHEKKEYHKAVADFDKAIEIDKEYDSAYFNRGLLYSELKEYDKALDNYNRVLELDETNAYAYNNRGIIWQEKKEYSKALLDLNHALALKHDVIWRPFMNRGKLYKLLADFSRENNEFIKALEYVEMALSDIEEALNNDPPKSANLEDDRKNLIELRKLINEKMASQATIKQVNEMKMDVEAAKRKIDEQARETTNALNEVDGLRNRMREQANQFDLLARNVKDVESKFAQEQIEVKALETFFNTTLTNFETKTKNANIRVLWLNIFLAIFSIACVSTIALVLKNNNELIKNYSIMIYMVSLTAIVLTPFIWMLRLAIKKRNEILLLETEYRHKTALASSLYSFKLTLGELYTKETTQMVFQTIYGNNPTDLLADGNSIRLKNKKEEDYPHVSLEALQKALPETIEKVVKSVLSKKAD